MRFHMRKRWGNNIWHWQTYGNFSVCRRLYIDILTNKREFTSREIQSTDYRICFYCKKQLHKKINGD